MTALILRGDARNLPLPDASIDLIVTSPPYYALRAYTDGGEHYDGQIGSEPTPAEYLENLWAVAAECARVLKPTGSIFFNVGDKYAQRPGQFGPQGKNGARATRKQAAGYAEISRRAPEEYPVPPKSMLGLPWRFALGCVDRLGLILRRDIVWCLSGGARLYVRTETGDRPVMLRDLVRAYRPDDVQVWNGEKWTRVLGWNHSPSRAGALEVELRTGERIGCTPGHRWPTRRGVIRADELRVGDVVQTTRLPEPDAPRQPSGLDEEEIGWLVGLYIAEGSRSRKKLQFAGHRDETARHARLRQIANAYHGNSNIYQTSENGVTCNVSGAVLLGIIDHYVGQGGTAKSKRLRMTAWQRSDRFLSAVVDGYLSGDGHFDAKNNRWRLGFCSNDEWAADLRTLAARLGAKISLRRCDHSFNGRAYPGWRGEWRWEKSTHRNAKQDGEIVAIRSSRAREFYDVGVEDEPHLFALASGVLTHNSKLNPLPESTLDRCPTAHEYLFHLTKEPRYFTAVDEIREPVGDYGGKPQTWAERKRMAANPLGKLPGSVWPIPSEPLVGVPAVSPLDGRPLPSHYAAYPCEIPRRAILGWSPAGICAECGEGRRPVADVTREPRRPRPHGTYGAGKHGRGRHTLDTTPAARITGYSCACPTPSAPTRPARVLDVFGGTGTTPLVADVLGRDGIGVDASHDYCRLARWRIQDPAQRAKAMRVPKPPAPLSGQLGLFEGA